jgi:2-iminoacetate synthase ThiH
MGFRRLLGVWWTSRSLKSRESVEKFALSLLNLPLIDALYNRAYMDRIDRKINAGLSSLYEISIETYNICNLKCAMCPYHQMTREKVLMGMELFEKIIENVVSLGIKRVCLSFYNEPLLDPLLFERVDLPRAKVYDVYLNSNGSLLKMRT